MDNSEVVLSIIEEDIKPVNGAGGTWEADP